MPDLINNLRKDKAVGEITPTAFGVSNSPSDIINPLVNVAAVEKTMNDISSIGTEFRTPNFIDSREYEKYNVSINPIDDDLEKQRAKNQGFTEQLLNSVAQIAVSEIGLGTALGFSNLADAVGAAVFDAGGDYSNPVSEKLMEMQESFRNATPIYQENPNETFQMGDFGWWAANAPTIASSLTLLIPAAAATKGLSMLGKGLKLGKAAKAVNKVAGASRFNMALTPSQIAATSKALEVGATAAFSRTMENYQEARQVYVDMQKQASNELNDMSGSEFNSWLDKNPVYKDYENKDDIAKDIASKSADVTFTENYANVVFDVVQLYALKNIWKGQRAIASTGGLQKANIAAAQNINKSAEEIATNLAARTMTQKTISNVKSALIGGKTAIAAQATEGVEEAINYISSQEGMYYGSKILNESVTSEFDDRLGSYLKDGHLWESAFWGVLGGITFQAAGSKLGELKNKIIDKEQLTEEQRRKSEIISRQAAWDSFSQDIIKIDEGKDIYSENKEDAFESEAMKDLARQRRENSYIADLTINAANSGNLDLLKSYLADNNVRTAMVEKGITTEEESSKYVANMLDIVQKVEDSYDRNILLLDNNNVEPHFAQIIATENVRYDLENDNINRNITKVDNDIARLSQEEVIGKLATVDNQQSLDLSVKILRLRTLRKELKNAQKGKTISERIAVRNIENEIYAIEDATTDVIPFLYLKYEGLISTVTDKSGAISNNNNEAVKFLDEVIEKEGDPLKVESEFHEFRKAQSGKYFQISAVSQELADAMVTKSAYSLQSLINNSHKTVTNNQIKAKVSQLNNVMDDARRTAINNSYSDIQKLYDKYDTYSVFDYINRKSKEIPNITEEDKNKLDDAINILDLDSSNNVDLYNDILNFTINAIKAKEANPAEKVNGVAVNLTEELLPPLEVEENPVDKEKIDKAEAVINPLAPPVVTKPIVPDAAVAEIPVTPLDDSSAQTTVGIERDDAYDKGAVESGGTMLSAIRANKDGDLAQMRNAVIAEYIAKGYREEDIAAQIDPIVRMAQRRRANIKNSTIAEQFQNAADDVFLRNSEIVENNPTEEYLNAVDNYIKKYSESIGIAQAKDKSFVNLETLMRYTKESTNDPQLANIIFNNIRDVLIDQSNKNGKYILTDKQDVESLSKESFFNNVNKTSQERLQEKVNEISKQRVDIYSQEETPEYIDAMLSLESGQNLEYENADGEIYIKAKGIRIGRLPKPTITRTGGYLMYNDGWKYELNSNNGKVESKLKDVFKEWLITRPNDESVKELNDIINNIAYNKALTSTQRAELIKAFENNKEIIKAKANGLIAANATAEQLLKGLASIYGYVGQQVNDIYKYAAITEWFNKLANSYNGVTALAKGNKQIKVATISDGEAIILTGSINIPVQEAIVGFNANIHKIMIAVEKGVLSKSGTSETHSLKGVVPGSTFVFLPNRNGNATYVQAFPTNINDKSLSPQIKDMVEHIRTTIKTQFDKKANGEITFAEFSSFINGMFSNGKGKTSLLGGVTVKEHPNKDITISINNTSNKITFFNTDTKGNISKQVGLGSKTYATSNSKSFDDMLNVILDSANFIISFGGIASDMHANNPFNNSSVLNKTDGNFNITIGDRVWTYNSYNDFLMSNNLVKVHLGKTEDGKSNFRRSGIKPGSNQVLNIQIEDITKPPVEVTTSPKPLPTDNASNIINTIINNPKIKNKGSNIIEHLTNKKTKDLFKRLGIIPENIIFVEELKDQNGTAINAQVNTRTGIVTITNKFLAMAETDPKQAFRKLIHEGLHNHIAKDTSVLDQISSIYDEFVNYLKEHDADNEQLNRYKFDGLNKEIQLEEFLVESLTSVELANYLNSIQSKDIDNATKSKTLFQKIMQALMNIMGIDINESSLYAKEFIALGELIKKENEITVKVKEETISAETNDTKFAFDIDSLFNSTITEYNTNNSSPSITSYLSSLPLSEQADTAALLASGELNFVCR